MKKVLVVALALLCLGIAAQADVLLNGFDTNPITVTDHGGLKIARIATPGMTGASWTFQASMEVTAWQHYASLELGVEGISSYPSLNQAFNRFWKGDDAKCYVKRMGGNSNGDMWDYFGEASVNDLSGSPRIYQKVNLWYDPALGFKGRLSRNGVVLWETGYNGFVNLTPTSIMVGVNDVDGLGSITYDAANRKIDYYSYVGNPEAPYTYSQAGSIYQLGLAQGIQDDLFPQSVPEPTAIVVLAGGLISLLGIRRRRS
jgi:hypothetical protein